MKISDYAKLIFNVNDLPRDVEQTDAFFRRFLIVPFDVTIPEAEQDKQLHNKIIENELSGVFNWVLDGLNRFLEQKQFSNCQASHQAREQYKTKCDSVKLFMEENNYRNSATNYKLIKDLYLDYRGFCNDDGYQPVNKSNFIKRLNEYGVLIGKKNVGNVAFLEKDNTQS
jgi:putative DNA primase/helicase